MSTDAVAILGFVALFALMLLRVPVGMAMGLVGVTGFAYLTGGAPALKLVGQTSMRTVTDYTVRRHPDVPADGRLRVALGHEPRAVPRRQHLRRPSARRARHRHRRRLRRLCRDLAARRSRPPRPSRPSPIPEMRRYGYPQSLRHRRDRGRRHAGRHAAALDRARRLRHHHPAGHRQAVHAPASSRACSRC